MKRTKTLFAALALLAAFTAAIAAPQAAHATPGNLSAVTVGGTDALTTPTGASWAWDNSANTLTIGGDIAGDIVFTGTATDAVTITIVPGGPYAVTGRILCNAGPLTFNGAGTLNVNQSGTENPRIAIRAANGLTIITATINATAAGINGWGVYVDGGFTMSSGKLTVGTDATDGNVGCDLTVTNATGVIVKGGVTGDLAVAGDVFFRDALGFYNYIREAARRGDPNAEVVYKLLLPRFKGQKRTVAEPTIPEVERDVRSLLHGTKEGEVVVRNVKPTVSGGEREVIDETKN